MRRRKQSWMLQAKPGKKNNPKAVKNKKYTGLKSPTSTKSQKICDMESPDSPSIRKKPTPPSWPSVTPAPGEFPETVPEANIYAEPVNIEKDHMYLQVNGHSTRVPTGEWS